MFENILTKELVIVKDFEEISLNFYHSVFPFIKFYDKI